MQPISGRETSLAGRSFRGYILLPGCGGKPAWKNKNRMSFDSSFVELTVRLREFIDSSSDDAAPAQGFPFERLASDLFALQFDNNSAYRRFCEARGSSPSTIGSWAEIPAVPAAAFKELELSCFPSHERTAVFYSSCTTGQRPSQHFHNARSLAIYEASLLSWFLRAAFPDGPSPIAHRLGLRLTMGGWRLAMLTPPPAQAPHSSLVYMFDTIRRAFSATGSVFLGRVGPNGGWTLDLDATVAVLKECSGGDPRVVFFGTAFSFVQLLDYLAAQRLTFELPPGSLVLETGGYKGLSRALPKKELHSLITERLGVQPAHIICEYGMTELSSQAYDTAPGLGLRLTPGIASPRPFLFPPWARTQIVSPETGREVREDETGLIRVFDLANVYSVMAIQTEDLGIRRGDGFEVLGRAAVAEPRGCSLMVT